VSWRVAYFDIDMRIGWKTSVARCLGLLLRATVKELCGRTAALSLVKFSLQTAKKTEVARPGFEPGTP
jgi:hypothetical protein